ncbi:S8 family serine peptidase [Polaribacter gangjinensis]|uniref:Peptidase S8 n=1 Tax=Polaribacter gangjinensis TaxID=574710 RepID=A0A2S7W906_9FLAO|nr:S8 family serine peptidase [Polaribacter gangjinensis]PQJ74110.1 hypothetical protein BTO13_01945 [Polaribacter gangjinensis]
MKKVLFLYFLISSFFLFSQQEDAWLYLNDKPNSAIFLANPLQMLSQRSLDRRTMQQIKLDETDVPIDENYYNQLKNIGAITILGKSKWLNAIHVQGTENDIKNLSSIFTFINRIEFANKNLNGNKRSSKKITAKHHQKFQNSFTDFVYGSAENQIKMLKGDYLHQQNLTGEGQIIAVLDAGFPNVNTLPAFKRVRDNNQILGGYNFADRNSNFYSRDSHGTNVLSTIAGFIQNEFVGSAPDAKFYLFITEIAETETVLEETLWVEAAEKADSLGVNVINTSLGYSTFDNPSHNYSYADMDGKTTFISRGAEIADSKGILVVNSAGNEGDNSWNYIVAPADATSVISVGAVNYQGTIASFSSFGPSSDGRVKPEILAQGVNAAVINHSNGTIISANGTSFSSPIMAGLIACLNQNSFFLLKSSSPKKSKSAQNLNYYLKKSIYESADRFSNPTAQHGFGIPNFQVALNNYTASLEDSILTNIKISPNPVKNSFNIQFLENSSSTYSLEIYNVLGKKVFEKQVISSENIEITTFKKGIYFLKIFSDLGSRTIKILKE